MRATVFGGVLMGLYLAVLGSLEPLDFLVGAVVAAIALRFRHGLRTELVDRPPLGRQALGIPGWALAVIREVVRGTAQVIRRVVSPHSGGRAGIVAVPFEERSERAVALGGLVLTLSPGEVVVDIDDEIKVMWIHAMNAEDPDLVRARHSRLYQRHQRRVVP